MEKGYIPAGMLIQGDVTSDGDLAIYGEVQGNVDIKGNLELNGNVKGKSIKVGRIDLTHGTIESDIECDDYIGIGKDVKIIGNISATNADIDGAVLGNIDIKESVSVGSTAIIKGELVAGELGIELGAVCDVNLEKSYRSEKASVFFDEYLEKNK